MFIFSHGDFLPLTLSDINGACSLKKDTRMDFNSMHCSGFSHYNLYRRKFDSNNFIIVQVGRSQNSLFFLFIFLLQENASWSLNVAGITLVSISESGLLDNITSIKVSKCVVVRVGPSVNWIKPSSEKRFLNGLSHFSR